MKKSLILAVDDNQDNLYLLQSLFDKHLPNCVLMTAPNGEEGLTIALDSELDGILIDVEMPGIDGIETCRRIKKNKSTAHVPVILITAHHAESKLKEEGLDSGADDFLAKPIDNVELIAKVKVMLRIKQVQDELRYINAHLDQLVSERTRKLISKIDEHKQAQVTLNQTYKALQESEKKYRTLFDMAMDGIAVANAETGELIECNNKIAHMVGRDKSELIGKHQSILHPAQDGKDELTDSFKKHLESDGIILEAQLISKEGKQIPVEIKANTFDYQGKKYLQGIFRNITERKKTEEELQRSEEFFRGAFTDAAIGMTLVASDNSILVANQAYCDMLGYTKDELEGVFFKDITHPDDVSVSLDYHQRLIDGVCDHYHFEKRYIHKQGNFIWAHLSVSLIREKDGKPLYTIAQVQDITEHKLLGQQLQQAQKMEAVGQLTGGIAHDFNNLLAIIQGNLELLGMRLEDDAKGTRHVEKSLFNVKRGAQLTQRLLAFSRKQMLQPAPLDLNNLVLGMQDLLQRTLGETIEIETVCAEGLWRCLADHAQVENCLLNLGINARDAMPDGGKLTIEVANTRLDDDYVASHAGAVAGQYVMLAVSDTGTGMSNEDLAHVFEPFYTTKGVGKGSGLGLSMVYGFTKQSKGYISVDSEVDEGTTFKLYLPRDTGGEAVEEKKSTTEEVPTGQHETVLVVEDEPDLLEIVVAQLEDLGYTVLSANDGATALEVAEKNEGIDVLLTDVILNGAMNGRDVVETLQKQCPALKVVYMSGYTEDAISDQGLLNSTVQLLKKPFTKTELARKIRAQLDG